MAAPHIRYPLALHLCSVAFSPDSLYLATANRGSNNITLFSVGTGGVLNYGTSYALPSGSLGPYSVTFSPDGLILLSLMVAQMMSPYLHWSRRIFNKRHFICIARGRFRTRFRCIFTR